MNTPSSERQPHRAVASDPADRAAQVRPVDTGTHVDSESLGDETAVDRVRNDDPSTRERGEGNYVASDPTVSEQRRRQRRDASDDLGM
ncbi:hypothetical protein N8I74_12780 [Chitiniphilus purpureus]|uniref:Uncharacterized protein n=1 Tax=Chitiniphilus purpureus TaxID=2981137 RepID=A0ABY6DJH6_9NEIS|nr:hypothetical protein [Chitiniphilus sp. CD1]UXY14192.1 hypothetical protein N8I74_12780 [Chitiniphilus sp. CD1]